MAKQNEVLSFYAKTSEEWREWLAVHGQAERGVRLIIYRKTSKTPSVHYEEAIEHALCFGWVDSRANKRDEESFFLFFSPRNPKSTWSASNRERVEKLTAEGLMAPAGQALVDLAKKKGTWDLVAAAETGEPPADLQEMLDGNPAARENFQAFPSTYKRAILEWILKAKRPETRKKRVARTVELAAKNIKTLFLPDR
ncbi:MAG: YdeI family protein [Anaerolineaceae bacterium]